MAVWIYREGERIKIDPMLLQAHLSAGWQLQPVPAQAATEPVIQATDETAAVAQGNGEALPVTDPALSVAVDPQVNAPETNTAGLTNEQIRQLAKENGIETWESAQIRTLKKQLGIE